VAQLTGHIPIGMNNGLTQPEIAEAITHLARGMAQRIFRDAGGKGCLRKTSSLEHFPLNPARILRL
jgi:hypothetical protein